MAPLPRFQGNSYGPMALKVRQKFPLRLVLVHGWLFPIIFTVLGQFSPKAARNRLIIIGAGQMGSYANAQSDRIQSNPIQSNPLDSNPLQSQPMGSNPTELNQISFNGTGPNAMPSDPIQSMSRIFWDSRWQLPIWGLSGETKDDLGKWHTASTCPKARALPLREASDAIAVRRVNSDAAFRTTFSRVWRFTLFAFASVIFTWLKYACVSPILTQGRRWLAP